MAKLKLTNIQPDNYEAVCNMLMQKAPDLASNYAKCYISTPKHCQISVDEVGHIYNLFFTERDGTNGVFKVHTIISDAGIASKNNHTRMMCDYMDLLFSFQYVSKLVCTVSAKHRLVRQIVSRIGFRLEGKLREEADGVHDLYYFGILKGEWNHGR